MANAIFRMDMKSLHKRVILKYAVLFLFNSSVLFYSYLKMPEKNSNYLGFVLILLSFFIFIFIKNYKRQMKIFSQTAFEVRDKTLKLYGENSSCTDVPLENLSSIRKDNLFGYPRIILDFKGNKLTYFSIENMDKFEREIENASGLTASQIKRNPILFILKVCIIYLPSLITYTLTTVEESKITIDVLYVIINLNTIFMIQNLSEDKMEGGFPSRTTRRIMIILSLLFVFQLYQLFNQ